MPRRYRDLHDFIDDLDAVGELHRVDVPVSAHLEITQITDVMSKSPGGGKALLFEDVEGYDFPILTNQFGSERRMAMALDCDHIDDIGDRVRGLLETSVPEGLMAKVGMIPDLLEMSRYMPRNVKRGRCQEIVSEGEDVDLSRLPALQCWPDDGGRFITLPLVFTKGLRDGHRNVGMYRMQVFDRNTTGMHWHIHKDGRHQYNEYARRGERMEVAVAIGTDPATTYAATAPMPRGMDEMLLSGFIRRRPVEMVHCRTVDLEVPADSEFVLEGHVVPGETRVEGPFGDHTGYYSLADHYPVFHVTAMTRRKDPIYPATIVGRPPMEDCYLAKATERLFLPPLRVVMPEVLDHWMPWEGVFHNIVIVAIDKEYPFQARKVMSGLWGSSQMSFAKAIVIIDDPELLKTPGRLFDHLMDTIDPCSDITLTEGVLDVLDHSSLSPLFGGKLGIDATRRVEGEPERQGRLGPWDDLPSLGSMPHRIVRSDVNPVVLVRVDKDGGLGSEHYKALLSDIGTRAVVVMLDHDIDLDDDSLVLWKVFNNVDPGSDISMGPWLVDATRKGAVDGRRREWPDDIVMSPDIVERVRQRADELGIHSYL